MPSAHPLIDHDDIRQWAEARKAQPSCVRRTGGKGDPGMIRLDMPGYSGQTSLAPISWDDWFKAFDGNNLALLVQDETARGQRSNFNKLVSRESIADGQPPRRQRKRAGAARKTSASSSKRAATGAAGTRTRSAQSAKKTSARTPTRSASAGSTSARSSRASTQASRGKARTAAGRSTARKRS